MTGVIERALGDEWADLHPKVRERYGLSTDGDVHTVEGRGTMDRITHGRLALPLLALGPRRNAFFPETGTGVPFEIWTDAFRDEHGREAVAFRRSFEVCDALGRPRTRHFDTTMVWSETRGRPVDYLGTGADIAVDIDASVDDGALVLESGEARLRLGDRSVALPDAASAAVTVRDRYDDAADRFRVALSVTNPLVGHVLGFEGSFVQATRAVTDPAGRPRRAVVSVHRGRLPRG